MRNRIAGVLREGLVGGMVAYLAVAVAFALLNVAQGRSPFHTAAAMGAVLFHGGDAASAFALDPAPILAYNGIHILGSLVVATVAAFLIYESELHRSFWYFGLMVLVAAVFYSIVLFGVAGAEIGGVLTWSTVVFGTLVWAGAMTAYFLRVHRGLLGDVRAEAPT
jgi:hypothetical protein